MPVAVRTVEVAPDAVDEGLLAKTDVLGHEGLHRHTPTKVTLVDETLQYK